MGLGIETAILAGAGAAKGAWEHYVKPELTAERAWVGMAAAITVYEIACPKGQTLSEGVDRVMNKHPLAVPLAIGYVAAHLCNLLPEKLDLFHAVTQIK